MLSVGALREPGGLSCREGWRFVPCCSCELPDVQLPLDFNRGDLLLILLYYKEMAWVLFGALHE